MLPSNTGLPGSDQVSQSQQSLVLEFCPTNQLVGSKFDSGDLSLLLIGSACLKDLAFAARGTSELSLTLNFHNTAVDSKLQAESRTSGTQGYLAGQTYAVFVKFSEFLESIRDFGQQVSNFFRQRVFITISDEFLGNLC